LPTRGTGALSGFLGAMSGGRHRSFKAYALAATFADRVHEETTGWPKFELWSVGIQLVRAADSIGANIAEGVGRSSPADQRRFFLIARGSLYETEHWLERAQARDLLRRGQELQSATEEIGRVLSGLIRTCMPPA